MKAGISISKCVFLLATVEFLLANGEIEEGIRRTIAEHKRKHNSVSYFGRSPHGSFLPATAKPPPPPPPFSFCGSDFYDQITSEVLELRLKSCCHYVDSCNDYIEPNKTKYGLDNLYDLRIVTCECDSMFKSCLDDAAYFLKDPIFNVVDDYYFIEKSRNCLQKLYNHSCDGPWFDDDEYEYDMNLDFYFFCPKLIPSVRRP